MSLHEYRAARSLLRGGPPFYGLIMAAMHRADTRNLALLRAAWPEVWEETRDRYNAPGGILPSDPEADNEERTDP